MLNKLLHRQLQKYFGSSVEIPKNFMDFLTVVSSSYDHYEKDRSMLERSIDLSSKEMIVLNNILRQEKEELKKINRELDNFVYSVSHDLRAPLSSMKGVVEITEEESKEELTIEHMSLLRGSIKKLDNFILDILDYSRNARLEVKKEEINFQEMLDDITNNLKHMTGGNRNIDINVKISQEKIFSSDKTRVSIVLNNLLSNAIRYQNPNAGQPFVNIKVDTSDTEANIIVKDNGIGISKELHEKIFDMFYRVSENSVGSGLGLYLVKETVNKLSGVISVESEVGHGTEFHIQIPNN